MSSPTSFVLVLDVWDKIASYVDSTRDLLSLALVSRSLRSLIIPDHIQYRHIRCDVRRKYVWQHLSNNRRLAGGVRSLELVDERKYGILLPRALTKTTHFEQTLQSSTVSVLIQSLSQMPLLKKFGWDCVPEGFSNIVEISRALIDKSTCLQALSVSFDWPKDAEETHFEYFLDALPIWQLSSLTKVILNHPCKTAQEMLIERCPNLEDLSLSAHRTFHCASILKHANWTKLRRLTLKGSLTFLPRNKSPEEQKKITIGFFERHQNLECLSCALTFLPPTLPDSALPILRSVCWDASVKFLLSSFLSQPGLSRIVHWQTAIRDIDATVKMPSLQTVQITLSTEVPSDLGYFFENAPNLQKASFTITGTLKPGHAESLVVALRTCTKLTHLYLANSFSLPEIKMALPKLSTIKTLRYIQVTVGRHDHYVKMKRDRVGKCLGYSTIPYSTSEVGPHPSKWGGFLTEF